MGGYPIQPTRWVGYQPPHSKYSYAIPVGSTPILTWDLDGGPPILPTWGGGVTPSCWCGYLGWGYPILTWHGVPPHQQDGYSPSWPGMRVLPVLIWDGVPHPVLTCRGVNWQTQNSIFPHPSDAGGNKYFDICHWCLFRVRNWVYCCQFTSLLLLKRLHKLLLILSVTLTTSCCGVMTLPTQSTARINSLDGQETVQMIPIWNDYLITPALSVHFHKHWGTRSFSWLSLIHRWNAHVYSTLCYINSMTDDFTGRSKHGETHLVRYVDHFKQFLTFQGKLNVFLIFLIEHFCFVEKFVMKFKLIQIILS